MWRERHIPEFPITHVVLTSDLGRSRPWSRELFGSDLVIDEGTGPFHHAVWLLMAFGLACDARSCGSA